MSTHAAPQLTQETVAMVFARVERDRREHPANAGCARRMKDHHSLLAWTILNPTGDRCNIEHTALQLAACAVRLVLEGDPEVITTLPKGTK